MTLFFLKKKEKKINTLRYMTEYRNPSSILKLFSEKKLGEKQKRLRLSGIYAF